MRIVADRYERESGKNGWPYLLIEGTSLYRPGLADEAVRGVILAVADLGVTVCRSEDTRDSARWIRRIGLRRLEPKNRDRPTYAQRPRRNSHSGVRRNGERRAT